MRAAEIRKRFLEYFRSQGHEVVPSSPVVPHDDPTLMFANAGMNQFKSVFTGAEVREYTRATTTQKCVRAGGKHNDLENVGYTARHLTFFEMLGNFSFGDYFKDDACRFAWQFVTEELKLDTAPVWITVHHSDREAREIWKQIGVRDERIVDMGDKDNFWSMGDIGPCGPCSEIFVDRGADLACGPDCAIDVCDCDRWLEFWNLVFMQFEQRADGSRVELPRPSIDTGMGLERIAQIMQGTNSVFETDLLSGIAQEVARVTNVPLTGTSKDVPHRVISDHVRTLSFAIADGAYPSNEGRGFVLRRILRRAARYGFELGAEKPFIYKVVAHLVREMGESFPELGANQQIIERLVRSEEESFGKTLRNGMERFDEEIRAMKARDVSLFSGEVAFFLHDTCGFPIDLTEQIARERDVTVDRDAFERHMAAQQERSRADGAAGIVHTDGQASGEMFMELPPTEFVGHTTLEAAARISGCEKRGDAIFVALETTPFYGEGGGQIGDTGTITVSSGAAVLRVVDTRKTSRGVHVHEVVVDSGDLTAATAGADVVACVDVDRRRDIERNHTATHLLHAALREILGAHVQQKGSVVAPDRLRFDVSHFTKIAPDEIREVEDRVNDQILRNTSLDIRTENKDDAVKAGAMAFFGDKYGDVVRVVEVPGYSVELCGGAHVRSTGEIGAFQIVSEGSVSSGVRRLEAVTGHGAFARAREADEALRALSNDLKVGRDEVADRIKALQKELKDLKSGKGATANRDLNAELASKGETADIDGIEVITAVFEGATTDELLPLADSLKAKAGPRLFALFAPGDGSVKFVVGQSKDVPKGRLHAGNIAKEAAKILGGGGGGRPDMAQAGGKDATKIPEAIEAVRNAARGR